MKKEILFLTLTLGCLLDAVNCQQCTIIAALTSPTSQLLKSDGQKCSEYFVGPMLTKADIFLTFTNNVINCDVGDNIRVYNEVRELIYDFCKTFSFSISYHGNNVIVELSAKTSSAVATLFHYSSVKLADQVPVEATTVTSTTTTSTTTTTTTTSKSTSTISAKPLLANIIPQPDCGVPFYNPFTQGMRIVGGIEAIPHSYPWQVFITNDFQVCCAALINSQWIITAAHCAFPGRIKAFLGVHNKLTMRTHDYIRVVQKIQHDKFDENTVRNDIALMKLERPVMFTDKIRPICIPNIYKATTDRIAMVIGWGLTTPEATGFSSDVLRQVSIPIRPNSDCVGFSLDKTQLCAGDPNFFHPKDSCQGDSGGPMFTKEGNRYYLVGIVSYGGSVCNGFGVYTNVFAYNDWIVQTLAKH